MLHALLVGINRYADAKIDDLQFAAADAEALATLLVDRAEGAPHVTLLLDEQATKARIAHVLTEDLPRRVRQDDEVLVFFAGYGCPEVDAACGDPSIHGVAHDTAYGELAATGINMVTELSAWVRRLAARHVAVVVDASFNGAAGGRTFEGPGLWSGPRTRRLDRVSLNRLPLGSNGALLAACNDKEVAREAVPYRHGVFTHHLLDHLTRTVGPLDLAGIAQSVADSVRTSTQGGQNPVLHAAKACPPLFRLAPQQVATALAG